MGSPVEDRKPTLYHHRCLVQFVQCVMHRSPNNSFHYPVNQRIISINVQGRIENFGVGGGDHIIEVTGYLRGYSKPLEKMVREGNLGF